MRSYLVLILGLPLAFSSGAAQAQTAEQDRRIEEEKREALRGTVAAEQLLTQPTGPTERPAPPVPQPFHVFYFATLAQNRIAFHYDAAKALTVLMGVDEEYIDLTSQIAYLEAKGFLPKRLRGAFDPMAPLRKGAAAYMFRQALGIRGGIALHLLGPSERYALKELEYQGILSPGNTQDLISGAELVQIMAQAVSYKVRHSPPPGR